MSDYKLLTGYVRRSLKMLTRHPGSSSLRGLIRDFQPWRHSLANKTTPAQEGLPWLTFGAIRFLDGWLKAGMRVFEYGCGGSTIFLAARVKEVVSVEHDEGWARHVVQQFERSGQTLPQILMLPPEPDARAGIADRSASDPTEYLSANASYQGQSFRRYAAAIDSYADGYFDLVIVDGRARPSCIRHAIPKVRAGGLLLVDNVERDYYEPAQAGLAQQGWRKREFHGPGPCLALFFCTRIWESLPGGAPRR